MPKDSTMTATLPQSWVASANRADTDFPLNNLPFGRFIPLDEPSAPIRAGVAIGDQVLDFALLMAQKPEGEAWAKSLPALAQGDMNRFMAQGAAARRALRSALTDALRAGSAQQAMFEACLRPQTAVTMAMPCAVGDYTDFYTGIHHALSVGKLMRPDNPLLPNYKWVPIGYHGRASSMGVSGQRVRRPWGQTRPNPEADPVFAPTRRMDYELELAAYVGVGNELGEPIVMAQAEDHLFGLGLLNDWSARDVQGWEYQPLGPFLAKNFATTLSPWIVTLEALEPFRASFERDAADPQPLPYLSSEANTAAGAFDITLEVWLYTAAMRERSQAPVKLMQSNARDAYWTVAQMLTHHASNGCNLQPGDVLGSGTLSGPDAAQGGSLLELTVGGKQPLTLQSADGATETRTFLEDADTVILRGHCRNADGLHLGFGDCWATVLPAHAR
jgi:fumarylacetoacetase